jgi:hypothetical protein
VSAILGLVIPDSASTPGGYGSSLLAASGGGKLLGFSGYSSLSTAQFILVIDTNKNPPTAGSEPIYVMTVNGLANFNQSWGTGDDGGLPFNTGLVICNSTTAPTLTLGAANCFFSVQYLLEPL